MINTGFSVPAKHGLMGKAKIFDFGQNRHGKHYAQKRVEVFFTTEGDVAITVTVYVFYGKWGA